MAKKAIKNTIAQSAQSISSANSNEHSQQRFSRKYLGILLAVITLLLYANTLQNGYVLDDATVITKNTIVTQGFSGIPELMITPRLKGFELTNNEESYRPLPMIMYAIEYQIFGANAAEGHFFNILSFIGCVVALFFFLIKLFPNKNAGVAFAASLLFAIHPIHTEVVANIKSRDELLCFLFAFLALNVFINYARQGKFRQLITGAVLLFLSLLSKETSITFLLVIPFVFFFYVNENRKHSVLITVATVGVIFCFLAVRASMVTGHHTNQIIFLSNPLVSARDILLRIATAIMVSGMYLRLLIIPYPLICDYSYNSIPLVGFGNIFVLISLALYLLLAIVSIYRLLKLPKDPLTFSILFFLGTMALFSNIPFLVYSELAERFLFFASVGFCLAAALAYERWIGESGMLESPIRKNRVAFTSAISICLTFSGLTIARNVDWKDNYTLFSTDLKKAPNDCELNFYLATEISQNRYPEETNPVNMQEMDKQSIMYLNQAIAIYPDFDEAHAELGRIYDRLHIFDSAIIHDKKAIAINPANSIAAYNLARACYFLKEYPEAIIYFEKTIGLNPNYTLAYVNLARCFSDYKKYDSAISFFNKTLIIEPESEIAKQGLANAMLMKSKSDTIEKQ